MKNVMKKYLWATVVASALAGPGAITTANAVADHLSFTASMCVRVSGPMFRNNWGSIYNPSNTTVARVSCPIVSTRGTSISEATILVTDKNSDNGKHVTCELVVVTRDTNNSAPIIYRSGRESTTGFGSDPQELRFFDTDFSPRQSIHSYENASKFLLCTIPPQAGTGPSYIHHYKVQIGS